MRFYLGTHQDVWLTRDEFADVPLFVSRRRLARRKNLRPARAPWVLDSGGFTELNSPAGKWSISHADYVAEVHRYRDEIGNLEWVAPMDWMCEPGVRARTGLTVAEHQRRTVESFLTLRNELGDLVAPVLQGWETDDYLRCVELYDRADVDLAAERIVGVGSICRRNADKAISAVLRTLAPLGITMHGFGVRGSTLTMCSDVLESADSLAWSLDARWGRPLRECTHKKCNNCPKYALAWRDRMLLSLGQLRMEVV